MQSIPREEMVFDRKARMKLPPVEQPVRAPAERVADFGDTYLPFTEEQARKAAERCIHCADPAPCQKACPLGNDISSAMWLIEKGDYLKAAALYRQTSSMPEVCGRVCPHEQLCQGACVRTKTDEPVLTGALEAFVADYERQHQGVEMPVGAPTGKRVAVIGAGPASLSCADVLRQKGHAVTIFEALPSAGGLLMYGIPNFKLNKGVVSDRLEDFEKAGVEFVPNTKIGKDRTLDSLLADGFEAAFIGVGSQIDAPLEAPGADLPGVYLATDFLVRANVDLDLLPPDKRTRPVVGRRVAVVGGGDTASDCLRTALRMGAEQVTCLYRRTEAEMPGGKKDRELAKEEGAKYRFLTQPVKFIAGPDGRVSGVECLQCELGEPDKSGRRRPVPIEGSNFIVSADTVILALGYWPDPLIGETTPDLKTEKYGLIVVDQETGATSKPGVYAGGDDVTGADIVAHAIAAGRRAALAIDEYLKTK
jgi:glutamate synthase (NADPH/NADH) small chain